MCCTLDHLLHLVLLLKSRMPGTVWNQEEVFAPELANTTVWKEKLHVAVDLGWQQTLWIYTYIYIYTYCTLYDAYSYTHLYIYIYV